ncbi:MAG: YigZ family protein [Myxococcota bacterium]
MLIMCLNSLLRTEPYVRVFVAMETVEAKLTVERSKFHALFAPASSLDEVKQLLAKRRRAVKKAGHHCWAARFAGEEHARDDGEVGKPGHRLLELLRRYDLEGVLIVSRVFGGVKLGPAGVGRAFRDAGQAAVDALSRT